MNTDRRRILGVGGAGLLTFMIGGRELLLTPAQAKAESVPLQVLTPDEFALVETLGEALVPGAAEAGLGHFIDHQLGAAPDQQMLMIQYLGVPAPWLEFYRGALAGVTASTQARHGKALTELDDEQRDAWVADFAAGQVEGWQGPPAGFFFFVLRSDAVDVVYGTQAGFEMLGIPYLAHVTPPSRWGE